MAAWWKILGVERGADLRAIKRAYAAKLKTIRQDEDPAEFMALRSAYEQARNAAQYKDAAEHHPIETDVHIETAPMDDDIDVPAEPEEPPAPTVMDDVVALMKTPWGGSGAQAWQDILEDERLDTIDDFTDFERQLYNYLLESNGYYEDEDNELPSPRITPTIASQIFTHFNWSKTRAGNSDLIWLSNRLGVTNLGAPAPNWFSRSANSTKTIRKKTPKTDKFTEWFDNAGGRVIIVGAVVLLYTALMIFGSDEDKETDIPDLTNTRKIQLDQKLQNVSNLDRPENYDFEIPEFNPQGPESLADTYSRNSKASKTPDPDFPGSDINLEGLELSPELQDLLGDRCKPQKGLLDIIIEKSGEKK